eukprot:COSAG06_NODE_2422_length_6906_cov_3.078336_2_plen_89_part_00
MHLGGELLNYGPDLASFREQRILQHGELLLVHDHGVAQRDCHVDDRSASPRRPIRTRFAAVRTRMRSLGAYLGSRGARTGRKVAVPVW